MLHVEDGADTALEVMTRVFMGGVSRVMEEMWWGEERGHAEMETAASHTAHGNAAVITVHELCVGACIHHTHHHHTMMVVATCNYHSLSHSTHPQEQKVKYIRRPFLNLWNTFTSA